ncbi:aspartyl aminopeptidase [Ceratobasidium sp. AG-Ba]|nr:aspartyl aminopeptidase [Ceratobasidium sp. AG-Ba]QRW01889.1 aspartyl aminopeptidase [Ceratobasidium sp. AG-Ba]
MVRLGLCARLSRLGRVSAGRPTLLYTQYTTIGGSYKPMVTTMQTPVPKAANSLLEFLNASPTPFHAVHNATLKLEAAGFQRIYEKDNWEKDLKEGGKYFFTRNQSSLIGFTLPKGWKEGAGFSIVATHTDSPCLKVRPISKRSKVGYLQVGIETYGGGIWHTWFDRDLSLAGRVVVTDKSGEKFSSKLVNLKKPILRIPSLAIHLDRTVNDNFKFNQETQFTPILGLMSSQLNASTASGEDKFRLGPGGSSILNNHHSALLELLANEVSVAPEEIHDFELCLYDVQPSQAGGIQNEFVFSPRLDNLMSSFCAVEALIESVSITNALPLEGNVNVIALFNHEEIGSVSTSGAESSLLPTLFHRLSPSPAAHAQSVAQSFLVSADMGHAVHPNYTSSHEEVHRPEINGGVVVKTNAKQRYATDAIGTFLLRKLVEKKGGRVQEFEVRNDMACGSTVGPMLSKLGMRTVDVGMPMLSMHSIRETAGTKDVQSYIDVFQSLFEGFANLDASLKVD